MKASIAEHRIASAAILILAAWVTYVSFTQDPASAFLFPRIIAVVMMALALWNFLRAITGRSKVGDGVSWALAKTIAPGIAITLIYVFFLAKFLGFYAASLLTYIAIYTAYDPAPFGDPKAWLRRSVTAIIFVAIIYGLFNILLKVQTPKGIFF